MASPSTILMSASLALAALIGSSRPAYGQTARSDRPYRGLFGSAGTNQSGQTLELNWSMLGARDDNVTTDSGAPTDPRFQVGGVYGTGDTSLLYSARAKYVTFSALVGSGGRYYPTLGELSGFDGHAVGNFSATIGQRMSIRATQDLRYQPYYQFAFPAVPAAPDVLTTYSSHDAVISRRSYEAAGRFGFERRIGGRSAFLVDYDYRRTTFATTDERFFFQQGTALFRHGITRNASLRLGYGYGEAENVDAESSFALANHTLDVGVDYQRALSFSRRTTFSFKTGSAIMEQMGERNFQVTGDATLAREIGRTWRATANYNRGAQFRAGFRDPFLADTAQVQLSGLVTRRLNVHMGGGYSAGRLGFGNLANPYSNWTATTGMRVALGRLLSADAEYFYYRYRFDSNVQLPSGLPSNLNRQGVRVGLSGWMPLVR